MKDNATDFMMDAIKCAIRAAEHNDVPIGAVIVKDGKIIARGENRVQKDMDPTQHAEIVAIRAAAKKLGKKFLDGCDIYVTLEPCAMCATAISFARMRKLIFAAEDVKGGAVFSGSRVYETDNHLWVPEIGINSDYSITSSEMLKKFFKRLRARKKPEKYGIQYMGEHSERGKFPFEGVGVARRAGVVVRARSIAKTKKSAATREEMAKKSSRAATKTDLSRQTATKADRAKKISLAKKAQEKTNKTTKGRK